jgi:transposase
MGYSSDVSDKEWEIIEPLLPHKKKTRPPVWTGAANSQRHILPTQKWL